eukprot:NODE_680_length_5258_cov_0.588486.p4 type:complete len:104 gc:universal NODE_680_length_5258_cov_0.588486:2164-1853(-)
MLISGSNDSDITLELFISCFPFCFLFLLNVTQVNGFAINLICLASRCGCIGSNTSSVIFTSSLTIGHVSSLSYSKPSESSLILSIAATSSRSNTFGKQSKVVC